LIYEDVHNFSSENTEVTREVHTNGIKAKKEEIEHRKGGANLS
jgi:hypothetical protein